MRNRRVRTFDLAGENIDRLEIALIALLHVSQPLCVFLVGQELTRAKLFRPFERDAELPFARPLSLQVGIAPRRALCPLASWGELRLGTVR